MQLEKRLLKLYSECITILWLKKAYESELNGVSFNPKFNTNDAAEISSRTLSIAQAIVYLCKEEKLLEKSSDLEKYLDLDFLSPQKRKDVDEYLHYYHTNLVEFLTEIFKVNTTKLRLMNTSDNYIESQ